jgi:hypothetical protein
MFYIRDLRRNCSKKTKKGNYRITSVLHLSSSNPYKMQEDQSIDCCITANWNKAEQDLASATAKSSPSIAFKLSRRYSERQTKPRTATASTDYASPFTALREVRPLLVSRWSRNRRQSTSVGLNTVTRQPSVASMSPRTLRGRRSLLKMKALTFTVS